MRCYFLLICLNYMGVYSKNFIVHMPASLYSRRVLDTVMKIVNPSRNISETPIRVIHLHLPKNSTIAPVKTNFARTALDEETNIEEKPEIPEKSEKPATNRKLAHKDDLYKALSQLAEKAHKCTADQIPAEKSEQHQPNPPLYFSNGGFNQAKPVKASNMDEVLQLMRKGVSFNKVHDLGSDKITWMKIKIPRKN